MMNIVTIGGGGGHAQVLKGLKDLSGISITGICPSTDSGGSTGLLAREYEGLGYLGDLTKCVAALTPDPALAAALLYRYQEGCLHGHSVKNILFLALEHVAGLEEALSIMFRICRIEPHRVVPVSAGQSELCAKLRLGGIQGETNIDKIAHNPLWNPDVHAIEDVYLVPPVEVSPWAFEAVLKADWIVVCPGDLYSSILPVLLPKGMKEAVAVSKAKVVVVLNIMTKKGETDNYTASDFLDRIEAKLGRRCEAVLSNKAPLPVERLVDYALENKVEFGGPVTGDHGRIIEADLLEVTERGELYHNPQAVAAALARLFNLA